jgi:hypothetical protein
VDETCSSNSFASDAHQRLLVEEVYGHEFCNVNENHV